MQQSHEGNNALIASLISTKMIKATFYKLCSSLSPAHQRSKDLTATYYQQWRSLSHNEEKQIAMLTSSPETCPKHRSKTLNSLHQSPSLPTCQFNNRISLLMPYQVLLLLTSRPLRQNTTFPTQMKASKSHF